MSQPDNAASAPAICPWDTYTARLERVWGGRKLLVKLFETEFGCYLYDPGTNKLLKCSSTVFAAIEQLRKSSVRDAVDALLRRFGGPVVMEALEDIVRTIDTEHILLTNPDRIRFESLHFSRLDEELARNLGQVTLEITEYCNLRCDYCIYNDAVQESRNHGRTRMAQATAFRAIEFLRAHSDVHKEPTVGFYGGEPLTYWQLITDSVEHALRVFGARTVAFAVTTNGTTVTREIARYLAQHKFGVTISIDGPKDVHDDFRVYADGRGTFDAAMRGLRHLVEAYGPEAERRINLSIVYTPPFSSARLEHIASLWKTDMDVARLIPSITYPHAGSVPLEKITGPEYLTEDRPFYKWAGDSYFQAYSERREQNLLVKTSVEKGLLPIFRRRIFDNPDHGIHLNGCCVPGARKIYVTTDGHIAVCERVHRAPPYIGHISSGIDLDLLRRVFVDEYSRESIKECAHCWCCRLCGICYIDTFTNGEYDASKKAGMCAVVRRMTEERLKLYSRLLHVNSEGLNHLADIEVS